MDKKQQIEEEITILVEKLRDSEGHVNSLILGKSIGLNINVTKEHRKLQARLKKVRSRLLERGEVLANIPSKGYIITEDQSLIFAESVKSLGRSMGGLYAFKMLLDRSGQSSRVNKGDLISMITKLRLIYTELYVQAIQQGLNMQSKPNYVIEEENA